MENISIVKGNPNSMAGARLNIMALGDVTHTLVGTSDSTAIEKTLNELWKLGLNRFSHQYAFEAQLNQKTVGLITCYPVSVLNKLAWPTVQKLIKLRKWALIEYLLSNLEEAWSLLTLKEGRIGEYHIGSIATLPESRGYGIGSKLIHFAEEQARLNHYSKTSLTVKKENTQARKLYERLGYKVVGSIEKKPYYLYRMVKMLPTVVIS